MNAQALLCRLYALGVALTPTRDGTLSYDAPKDMLTSELLERMGQHKAELLGILTAPLPAPLTHDTPCVVCGRLDRWDDAGIWRCRTCWPEPVTEAARQAGPNPTLLSPAAKSPHVAVTSISAK